MQLSKKRLPIAAAVALALACGSAVAAGSNDPNQNDMNRHSTSQNAMNNGASTNDMSVAQKSAFREGQLWATYVINPVLQSYKIDADVNGHNATLTGTVGTRFEKMLAQDLAQATQGINHVDNQIMVKPDVVVVTTFVPANVYARNVRDATTSARVNARLLWNEYTDASDIRVKTRDGKVTLTGLADTSKAKKRATKIAAATQGVDSVDNRLTLNGATAKADNDTLSDSEIASRLQSSYWFAVHVDAADLKVDVNDGKAVLSGTVDSNFERQRAIDIAQHTRGVTAVDASAIKVMDDQARETASTAN